MEPQGGLEGALARALLNDAQNRCCPNPRGLSTVAKAAAIAGGLIMMAGIILAVVPSMPTVASHVLIGVGTPLFTLGFTAVVIQSNCLQGDTKWKVALAASLIILGGGIALITATTGGPTIAGQVMIALGSWGLFGSLIGGCVRSCMPADHPVHPVGQDNPPQAQAPAALVLAHHPHAGNLDREEELLRDGVHFLRRAMPFVGNLIGRFIQNNHDPLFRHQDVPLQPQIWEVDPQGRPLALNTHPQRHRNTAGDRLATEEVANGQDEIVIGQPQQALTPEQRAARAQRLHAAGLAAGAQQGLVQEERARRLLAAQQESAHRNYFLNELTIDERAAFCTGSWDIDWNRREQSAAKLVKGLFEEHQTREQAIYAGWFNNQQERPFVAWFRRGKPNELYLLHNNGNGTSEVWSFGRDTMHQHQVLSYASIHLVSLSQHVRETGQLPRG